MTNTHKVKKKIIAAPKLIFKFSLLWFIFLLKQSMVLKKNIKKFRLKTCRDLLKDQAGKSWYLYIYICVYVYVYIYMYMCMYISRPRLINQILFPFFFWNWNSRDVLIWPIDGYFYFKFPIPLFFFFFHFYFKLKFYYANRITRVYKILSQKNLMDLDQLLLQRLPTRIWHVADIIFKIVK